MKELPTQCQSVQDVLNTLHFQETKKRGESAKRKKCWGGERWKWEKKSSVKIHILEVSDIGCGVLILFRIRAVKFSFFVIIVIILMPQNDTHSSNISRIQFVLLQKCRLRLKDNLHNSHSVPSYNLQFKHICTGCPRKKSPLKFIYNMTKIRTDWNRLWEKYKQNMTPFPHLK